MKNKWFNIINREFYLKHRSLEDEINFLSDPKNQISSKYLINLVTKYIFCYYHLDFVDKKIPLDELNNFFIKINKTAKIDMSFEKDYIFSNLDKIDWFYHAQDYPLRMAMDIASTVKIVEDIVSRKINKNKFEWNYMWMDLWSWIWILTLAQAIQARRNGFKNIYNIWFEIWKIVAQNSNKILEILGLWKVIIQDTTKKSLFNNIPQYSDITFISNETICDPYQAVNIDRSDSDPFFENNSNIFTNGNFAINDETQFFPCSINIQNNRKKINLNKKNNFFSSDILLNDTRENYDKYSCWELRKRKIKEALRLTDSEFFFSEISILGNLIPLEKVWIDLIIEWLVNRVPNLSPRWCKNRTSYWK